MMPCSLTFSISTSQQLYTSCLHFATNNHKARWFRRLIDRITKDKVTLKTSVFCYASKSIKSFTFAVVRPASCRLYPDSDRHSSTGFISSQSNSMTSCGASKTPWLIESEVGQTITVTLYDFGVDARASDRTSFHGFTHCHLLAVVKETSGGRSKNLTVCAGDSRELVVLSTHANRVEIVSRPRLLAAADLFLVKYEGEFSPGCSLRISS